MVSSTQTTQVKENLLASLHEHQKKVTIEHQIYVDIYRSVKNNPGGGYIHLTLNISEKVLLPHLCRQPGQVHFVTGRI